MAAPKVEIVKDADGGVSLVGTVDGVYLTFATVNPSQATVAAQEQGKSWDVPAADAAEEAEG